MTPELGCSYSFRVTTQRKTWVSHIKKDRVTLFLHVVSSPVAPPTSMGIIVYRL